MDQLLNVALSWPMILLAFLTFLYWHFTKTFDHWKRKGVKFEKPIIIFGNIKDRMLFRKSFHEFQLEMYKKFKGLQYAGKYKVNSDFFFRNSIIYLFVFLFCFVFFMCELKVVRYIENHLLKKTDVYFYECLTYSWEYTMFLLRKQIYPVC